MSDPESFFFFWYQNQNIFLSFLSVTEQKTDKRTQSHSVSMWTTKSETNGSNMQSAVATSGLRYFGSQWDSTFYNLLHFLFEYH